MFRGPSSIVTGPTQKSPPFLRPLNILNRIFHWKLFGFALLLMVVTIALYNIRDLSDQKFSVFQSEVNKPWHVTIAHEPRFDLLGSFVFPTILLYSVTQHHNWTLQIFPFTGSTQHAMLTDLFAQKGNLTKDWGSGFQDVSHRSDYNPMELNDMSYFTIGFFPAVSKDPKLREKHPWIIRNKIPRPGKEMNDICEETNPRGDSTTKDCYILLSDDPYPIIRHMKSFGGIEKFFTPTFTEQLRTQFFYKNRHRLQQYEVISNPNSTAIVNNIDDKAGAVTVTTPHQVFNVAIHIRRGDILDPKRWIDQKVFANVAQHICQTNNNDKTKAIITNIHVFSSGENGDGKWSVMEDLARSSRNNEHQNSSQQQSSPVCANVYFHLDELEFDSWTFFIAADALVISPSTFSYIPALIRRDNVYFPRKYWHPALSSFTIFDDKDGRIINKMNLGGLLRGIF